MNELLSVAVAIIGGLVMTRIIKPLHLPDVTAYLLTGVVLGMSMTASTLEGDGETQNLDRRRTPNLKNKAPEDFPALFILQIC